MAWAARRGDVRVTNLQHDGIVVDCDAVGMDPRAVELAMGAASSEVLGYDQPVEEKPIGEDVSASEGSDSD